MSTNDVPGHNPSNRDQLAMGAWAEHEDGSLILVESTEGGRVVYSIFEMSTKPIVEFRDAMAEGAFKKTFSWDAKKPKAERWTWHDKTAFPWDRIIRGGGRAGERYASADDHLTAAERVRRAREIHGGRDVDPRDVEARVDRLGEKAERIINRLQRAIRGLRTGDGE